MGTVWLISASLVFYAFAGARGLPYLVMSALGNWLLGSRIASSSARLKHVLLWCGLAGNISLLLVVKYSAFFLEVVDLGRFAAGGMGVPVGISFYTLIQVMYLVDCFEGLATPNSLLDHFLFSSFFPYITMGPLVRARDMKELLRRDEPAKLDNDLAAQGLELFVIGLFKKAVVAQSCAHLADTGWGLARNLTMVEAWVTTLAFTFELYFDFSGYSDMAVGAARFFGVKLPLNFDSPYKARSVIAFWRRWHISLSSFITTYLYTPFLRMRRRPTFGWAMASTILAMTIAGLWHGAAWTYVVFGVLHGVGLVVNNVWRKTKWPFPSTLGWLLTFLFLVCTLVLFRASSLAVAARMFGAMLGRHGVSGFDQDLFVGGAPGALRAAIAAAAGLACFTFPNADRISSAFTPSVRRAVGLGVLAVVAVIFMNSLAAKEFIYRDF